MDAIVALGIAVFIGSAIGLYTSRNVSTRTARIVLVATMIVSAAVVVIRHERARDATEAVWLDDAPKWSKVPLGVYWDVREYSDYNTTFQAAIDVWNERIGCDVFKATLARGDATVVVRSNDGSECGHETTTWVKVKENPLAPASLIFCNGYVEIITKRLDDVKLAFRIMMHEYGHAVGLDHDDRGAMAEVVLTPTWEDPPEYLLPSDKDVKALKGRYCQ